MMRKLSMMDLIEKALFTESQRTLLPLVLVKAEQSEMKKNKKIPKEQKLTKKMNILTIQALGKSSNKLIKS